MAQTWLITGAARGIGLHIVKAALAAGHNVIATARKPAAIVQALGSESEHLLTLPLDVTDYPQVEDAIHAAQARFGRIDVLVNNAGYGLLGPFEEHSREASQAQFATNVFGLFDVCRAVLPIMRQQRAGHIFNIASIAGVMGMPGASLYCASKFAVSGFSEALAQEVAGLGIKVTVVQPGAFQTDFLDPSSAQFGLNPIDDYQALSSQIKTSSEQNNHKQQGDPAKLAAALLQLANAPQAPSRFLAGADALKAARYRVKALQAEMDAWQELSVATAADQ
ncbi:oxidoreductase [Halopseudomonas sabulinigri]|uniref:Oxidoreductase n=1 Tax=Halopseudomonas sabulinigri TaxID=472181 RepID=A0ABP9ZJX0_9GAMM